MSSRRKYLNFTTPSGVDLGQVAKSGWSAFLIHECGYLPQLENWNHQDVDSPFWRFYHNPQPGCHLQFKGERIPLDPNSCVLIPADTVFDCCGGPEPACHLWLHFTASRPGEALPVRPVLLPVDDVLRVLLGSLIELHTTGQAEGGYHRLYHQSSALLHAAFGLLKPPSQSALPERLLEVLTLIHRAPYSDLSNPFLASCAGMSVERFIRSFREHIGQTPAAYVIASRIRAAEQALALTDKSIDQVAIECGFPNRQYFSRVFSRQLGCGPAEFRKRQRDRRGM